MYIDCVTIPHYLCSVKNKNPNLIQEAKFALEYFCSYRERTQQEVEQKLQSMDVNAETCQIITVSLLEDDFLNEERYAKSFVRGKFRINKWGKMKIRQALLQKGVSESNIKIGFLEIDEEEYRQTIQNLAHKQQPKIKAKNEFERKQKLSLYLRQKGYEMSLIYKYVFPA